MTEDKKSAVRAVETGERKDRVLIVEDEENARKGYEQLLHAGAARCWAWAQRKTRWRNSAAFSQTR